MGHKNLPTGDAVALGQRERDAVDVFLQCPSQMCINHREGKEEKQHDLNQQRKRSLGLLSS